MPAGPPEQGVIYSRLQQVRQWLNLHVMALYGYKNQLLNLLLGQSGKRDLKVLTSFLIRFLTIQKAACSIVQRASFCTEGELYAHSEILAQTLARAHSQFENQLKPILSNRRIDIDLEAHPTDMEPLRKKGVKALAIIFHVMFVNVTSSSLPLLKEPSSEKFKKLIETISLVKSQKRLVQDLTPPAAFM